MKQKILTFAVAVAVFISAVATANAKTGSEPGVVELVTNGSGTLRSGVKLLTGAEGAAADAGSDMTDSGKLANIADGKDNTFWYSKHKYFCPYVIVDLGKTYTLTHIRYLPFDGYTDDYADENGVVQKPGNYWRNSTEIQISNDADFSSYKTVWSIGYDGIEDNTAVEVELEDNINQYRYVRIYRTVGEKYDYPIGIREISVSGYDEFLPQDMLHNADDSIREGVRATCPNGIYNQSYGDINYTIDNRYRDSSGTHGGSNTTYISQFDQVNPYIQLDLGAVRGIAGVRVQPFRGNSIFDKNDWYYRSGLKIYGSNNPTFEGGGMLLYDQGEYSSDNYVKRGVWLETELDEIMLFRYIRIVASGDVIGISEIQVEGYELFEDIAIACETAPEIYFTTDGSSVTAKVINGGDNILMFAAYGSEGNLEEATAASGSATLSVREGCTYKAFLWESLTKIVPVMPPVIYK